MQSYIRGGIETYRNLVVQMVVQVGRVRDFFVDPSLSEELKSWPLAMILSGKGRNVT